MECNKEEAIRAKELAEKKLKNGDFQGARRIALKAQRLYPNLDNISQLLTVCDVHCAAENKLYGSEMDWYGILQIERSSDELIVKKQFRKLALSLHPDKNKFPGAEAAFKIIGEANRVLTDQAKRIVYDVRCGSGVSRPTKPKPDLSNPTTFVKKPQPAADKTYNAPNYMGPHSYKQPEQGVFWTRCPPCNMWYQYHRQYQKKVLKCQNCSEPFIAHDSGTPSNTGFTEVPMPKATDTAGTFQSGTGKDSKPQGKANGHVDNKGLGNSKGTSSNKRSRKPVEKSSDSFDRSTSDGKQNGSNLAQKSQFSDGHQSRRSITKPNITCNEKSNDDDFVVPPKKSRLDDSPIVADKEAKEASGNSRSSKRDPSACFTPVDLIGQDDKPSNKQSKTRDCKATEDEKSKIGENRLNSNPAPDSDIYVFPDSDFSNFEKEREGSCFAVNQVWAIYDSVDSMPRFYARIRKVNGPGFKLQITWLETKPINKDQRKWARSGLPVAAGRYVNGDTEITEDNLMFSHKMQSVHSGINGCYFVYPNKGETWALYKNWDLKWSAEPDKHVPPFDFDLVVILTDFIEDVGIGVGYLGKVKGFISIFQREAHNEVLSFTIRPNELYKFSHQVPSFELTGNEGEGVPVGSYELDTAALPTNYNMLADNDKIRAPKNLESSAKTETISPEISSGKDSNEANADQQTKKENSDNVESASTCHATEKFPLPKKPEKNKFTADTFTPRRSPRELSKGRSQIPENRSTEETIIIDEHPATSKDNSHVDLDVIDEKLGNLQKGKKSSGSRVIQVEPYDFKKEKTEDKFQVDQIWALLNDEDGLPKIYCQVKKINRSSGFKLHVAMLKNIKQTAKPPSCGIFRVTDGELVVFPLTKFSHQVKARPIGRDAFEIWPKQGEIWAIKRNSDSDKDNGGEFDIVEVVEDSNKSVKVTVLTQMKEKIFVTPKGLKCVSMDIRRGEFADRFSHQCLAFHMGDEDRRLKGSWQLDPTSIPGSIIVVE